MRFIIGNMDGKALNLNANELCILEAIGKCSRGDSAKGWYGSMQALADVLPFVIDRSTVDRAVKHLLQLGLIERNENRSIFIAQIAQNVAQNAQENVQIAQNIAHNAQNSAPLNNLPIKNINEQQKLKETTPCVHATENKGVIFMNYPFESFIQAFKPTWKMTAERKAELRHKWENEYSRAKKKYIMDDLYAHEAANTLTELRDPLTYCEKFEVPAPTNYRGNPQPEEPIFSALYNGAWGMYTQKDIDDYKMEMHKE